jgi:hypothetical protein
MRRRPAPGGGATADRVSPASIACSKTCAAAIGAEYCWMRPKLSQAYAATVGVSLSGARCHSSMARSSSGQKSSSICAIAITIPVSATRALAGRPREQRGVIDRGAEPLTLLVGAQTAGDVS